MPPPAATQAAARLRTTRCSCSYRVVSDDVCGIQNATGQLIDAVHTRACTGIKNAYNSVTVQNRTHVYVNFFHHKDLGNRLQLCPEVVKHPV
jgi:hypothetical protein